MSLKCSWSHTQTCLNYIHYSFLVRNTPTFSETVLFSSNIQTKEAAQDSIFLPLYWKLEPRIKKLPTTKLFKLFGWQKKITLSNLHNTSKEKTNSKTFFSLFQWCVCMWLSLIYIGKVLKEVNVISGLYSVTIKVLGPYFLTLKKNKKKVTFK